MLTDLERWPGLTSFAREWLGMDHVFGLAEVVDCPAGRHLLADFLGNHDWARDHWGALVRSMELVAEGKPALVGVLGEWKPQPGVKHARRGDMQTYALVWTDKAPKPRRGWEVVVGGLCVAWGMETGTAGMAAADKAAQDTYWLLGPKEEG